MTGKVQCQLLGEELDALAFQPYPGELGKRIFENISQQAWQQWLALQTMLIMRDNNGRVLLERRPPTGIWGGLWSFPEGDSIESIEQNLGLAETRPTALPQIEHRLSHVRMLIHPSVATSSEAKQVKCSPQQKWFHPADHADLGLPKPISDLLLNIHNGECA